MGPCYGDECGLLVIPSEMLLKALAGGVDHFSVAKGTVKVASGAIVCLVDDVEAAVC